MPQQRPHLQIPSDRVRTSSIAVRGRAKAFSRPDYSAHGDFLRERAASIRAYSEVVEDASAAESLFLQVRTPESLPARGEKQRLGSAGLRVVALSSVDVNSATVQIPKRELARLQSKVDRYATTPDNIGKSYLSVIEDLTPVPIEAKLAPEIASADDAPIDCLLVFYSTLTEKERAAVLFAVRSFMARRGARPAEERRLSNGVTLVEATLRPSEAREAGAAFSTLRHITPNHVFFVPDAWQISALPAGIRVDVPRIQTAVALIDTGVGPACTTLNGVVSHVIPHLPLGAVSSYPDHGTFVASRVVYGDDLEQELRTGTLSPLCPLVDVPVIGVDSRGRPVMVHEGHLAAAIDSALPNLPSNARVVNISLGNNTPVVDGEVSIVAQIVDKHARERDLLVVTTAGNIRDTRTLSTYPTGHLAASCRIDSPGDSLLALTVGSYARFHEPGALSRTGELSAFSRRGPGPFGGIKPDVVAHGGNCTASGTTSARVGAHGLVPSGLAWACDFGTSFAAPIISSFGAQLFEHYESASANLVRALLLHFTNPILSPPLGIPAEHLVGLGEPNLEAACWSRDHSATYLHVGELAASQFTYLPFVVPACLAEGGSGRLRIKATVVIDPPVAPDNQLEYCGARMTLALRKPSEVGHARVSVAGSLVEADKWCPVSQLNRVFTRSYSSGEWELQLRLWTRDLPASHRQRYAAIIEVIDDAGVNPVRTDAEAEGGSSFTRAPVRTAA